MKKIILFKEAVIFAFQALRVNKLRTSLSVLGITVGIFCIILVLTIVSSLERNIKDSVNSLGSDVIYIQKWPWTPEDGEEYAWWKYVNRPNSKLSEMNSLKKVFEGNPIVSNIAFYMEDNGQTIKNGSYNIDGASVYGITYEYNQINYFEIAEGRYFTEDEMRSGKNLLVIGSSIAQTLFGNSSAIGKQVKLKGNKYIVIGVIEKQGQSMLGFTLDDVALMSVNQMTKYININRFGGSASIMIKAGEGINTDMVESELVGKMRNIRKLKPRENQNFSLNKITMLTNSLDKVFGSITFGGIIIGGFSILVGGFGIAKIMFVSVNERTAQIGIQKSIGAKKAFIIWQFLTEAILLSLLGGLLGILLVYILTLALSGSGVFPIFLTTSNFIIGTSLSIVIGIVSGIIPAFRAANLDPVEAIRSKM